MVRSYQGKICFWRLFIFHHQTISIIRKIRRLKKLFTQIGTKRKGAEFVESNAEFFDQTNTFSYPSLVRCLSISGLAGGGDGSRTHSCRFCRPMPSHLATPPLPAIKGKCCGEEQSWLSSRGGKWTRICARCQSQRWNFFRFRLSARSIKTCGGCRDRL